MKAKLGMKERVILTLSRPKEMTKEVIVAGNLVSPQDIEGGQNAKR